MKKAILLNDTQNWYHWGCYLTSHCLKALIAEKYALQPSVSIMQLRQIPYAPQHFSDFTDAAFLQKYAADNSNIINMMQKADVIFINGEGSMHGSSALALNLLLLVVIGKLVLNKTVCLVNHSVYPNDSDQWLDNPLGQLYARVYQLLDDVAIREPVSLRLMQQAGIEKARQAFDCSVLALAPSAHTRERTITIGGSVAFTAEGVQSLLQVLQPYRQAGYRLQFVYGAAAHGAEDDLAFLRLLNQQDICRVEALCCHSIDDFVQALAQASLLVSGRFHYTLAAYALGTPPVLLGSNTPKNHALADWLALPGPLPWQPQLIVEQLHERIKAGLHDLQFAAQSAATLKGLQGLAAGNILSL